MRLLSLPLVDSTNSYAQQLIEEGLAPEKTVILSLEQTSGRGQYGNRWESDPGVGLYMSVVLEPKNILAANQFVFNKAIACAVSGYVADHSNRPCCIKWPNDLLVDGKKIGGILIENNIRGNHISSVVVGVGINLNQRLFQGDYGFPPVSMYNLTGKNYFPEMEASHVFDHVWHFYQLFMHEPPEKINEMYRSLLYRRDEVASFRNKEKVFEAVLTDVDNTGAALLNVNGQLIRALHPETRFHSSN